MYLITSCENREAKNVFMTSENFGSFTVIFPCGRKRAAGHAKSYANAFDFVNELSYLLRARFVQDFLLGTVLNIK